MSLLTQNFSLHDMLRSQTAVRRGIDNTPPPVYVDELYRLCVTALEPIRALLGVPLHVDSGYRCPALNKVVGGAATSAHLYGRAADVVPIGINLRSAFDMIRGSRISYDQIIIEANSWLHIGIADAAKPIRRESMIATRAGKKWKYVFVN